MKGLTMSDLPSRHGPLSTIAGWMTLIAVLGVVMGAMIVVPALSFLVVLVLFEALAAIRFQANRRGGQPSGDDNPVNYIITYMIVIPIVAIVAALIGLFVHCLRTPDFLQFG
jgi:small-conductance mechanosensitive channel